MHTASSHTTLGTSASVVSSLLLTDPLHNTRLRRVLACCQTPWRACAWSSRRAVSFGPQRLRCLSTSLGTVGLHRRDLNAARPTPIAMARDPHRAVKGSPLLHCEGCVVNRRAKSGTPCSRPALGTANWRSVVTSELPSTVEDA
ncbi:hypothetical protein IG631_23752 [Alternaria alternata]|jgi:hypothetical protein|nr:hypothetical protein IG631_23752 [Alternaria alternata]